MAYASIHSLLDSCRLKGWEYSGCGAPCPLPLASNASARFCLQSLNRTTCPTLFCLLLGDLISFLLMRALATAESTCGCCNTLSQFSPTMLHYREYGNQNVSVSRGAWPYDQRGRMIMKQVMRRTRTRRRGEPLYSVESLSTAA